MIAKMSTDSKHMASRLKCLLLGLYRKVLPVLALGDGGTMTFSRNFISEWPLEKSAWQNWTIPQELPCKGQYLYFLNHCFLGSLSYRSWALF